MFSVKDEPGILYRMLEPFSKRDINLAKIESRPMKNKAWEYIFFLDMEGHIEEEKCASPSRNSGLLPVSQGSGLVSEGEDWRSELRTEEVMDAGIVVNPNSLELLECRI